MFKDMYRPVEEDDEFSDDASTTKKKTETPVLASVDALALQLQSFMQQQQQWQEQMTQNRWQGSRSPRNRASMVATTTASSSSGNGGTAQSNYRPFRGISMGDDGRTQDGVPTIGSVGDHAVGTDREEKVIVEVKEVGEVGVNEVEVEDVCSLSVVQESVPEEKIDVVVIEAAEEKIEEEVFEVDKEASVSTTFCDVAENTVDANEVTEPKAVETSNTVVVK
ncbi:hypothetical protein PI125_g11089 [Phytophthora idaei]|nr:hypothetical protein PI125_g11089 [Phytophthora idaei]